MKRLFNIDGDDVNKKIINGDTSNVFDLYNIKYRWAYDIIFKQMLENHWIPEKVNMSQDKTDLEKLTHEELYVIKNILSFLIFLDSIQTNNLTNIQNKITASEVVLCIARQIFEEALHSRSYGYILTSIFTKEDANEIIYLFKNNDILKMRCLSIAQYYENYIEHPDDDEKFLLALIANYILEGVYFYQNFIVFYNFANKGLLPGITSQIRYINRDEQLHCELFRHIINEVKNENRDLFVSVESKIIDMFNVAMHDELEFNKAIIKNNILGINDKTIEEYVKFLTNKRMRSIGLAPLYADTKNPYSHLTKIAGIEEDTNRNNIFSTRGISYTQSSSFKGWDEI